MTELTQTEREILEEIAGLREPRPWGSHVGAALEFLHEAKYITRTLGGQLTEKGRKALKESK